jgi:CHAT domain-containing protein
MLLAVEQGFMLQSDLDKKLRARIPPLILFLRSRGRRYAEAECFFLTNVHQFIPSQIQAADFIRDYMNSVDGEGLGFYKAFAKSQLAKYQISSSPESARLYLNESQRFYASEGCLHHLANIDFIRVRDFQNATHTLPNRIDQLCSLIGRYRSLGDCWMLLITFRLALYLVSPDDVKLWGKIESISQDMERSLQAAGDVSTLHVARVVKLLKLSTRLQESEETRRHLVEYLDKRSAELTPDLYGFIFEGLYNCYCTLGDFELAAKYAKMETESEVAKLVESRMSDAVYHLAGARKSQLKRTLENINGGTSEANQRQALTDSFLNITHKLERWADWDLRNERIAQRHSKCSQLVSMYCALHKYCPNQGYSEKIDFWTKERQPKDDSQVSLPSMLTQYIQLMAHKKYEEGYEFAEKAMKDFSLDSTHSAWDLAQARRIVVLGMQGCFPLIEAKSLDLAREWREKQLKWLLEDTYLFYLDRSSEELLDRADLLCWVMSGYMEFFPNDRAICLNLMVQLFRLTDRVCYDLRHSLKGDLGVSQLLRRRIIASKDNVRSFYEHAAAFFVQVGDQKNAWYWIQRKRGQALLDMIAERSSAYEQIESTFTNDGTIRELLSKEDTLVSEMANANATDYLAAVENLTSHREEMKKIPALRRVFDESPHNNHEYWNDLGDIWSIADWLPTGTNIILIDWFVTPNPIPRRQKIYWLSRDLKRKDSTPECKQLTIGLDYIDKWIAKYLQFPNDREKPLEKEPRAIRKLEGLLDGLAKICKPGDLVILTPPAQFASIPIHAIPMERVAWIERNPIIYSSSFSLYRECLKCGRVKSPVLSNAVLTAAYEEPGYEAERKDILKHVEATAGMLGGQTILGTELTSTAFRKVLTSAPWIHYHGHAYYDRSEVLRQSFVLSGEQRKDGRQAEVDSAREMDSVSDEVVASMQATSLYTEDMPHHDGALLSTHLLKDSSQVTVSDIFTLDLSKNHPFVCSIACESGLQTIAAGDEPLGLVTALFVAGASSVLGTLWPIYSSTGRKFASHFYQSIEKQRRAAEERTDVKVKVLNLALAVQEATIKVKNEGADPHSWAAFVLHGAGFYIYEL